MLDLDRNVGRVLDCLETLGLKNNTLVIFASDKGPATVYGNHAGSAYPLRGAKSTEFDGGVRTPCIMYWPGTIAPGKSCDTPAATVDILPTLAAFIDGAQLPNDRTIDDYDIRSLFLDNMEDYPKALYDMENDPQESVDVQDKYPEIVAQIDSMANIVRTDIWKK